MRKLALAISFLCVPMLTAMDTQEYRRMKTLLKATEFCVTRDGDEHTGGYEIGGTYANKLCRRIRDKVYAGLEHVLAQKEKKEECRRKG